MLRLFKITYRHLIFVLSFITAKGTVFFVPLLLADSISQNDFGIVEYSLAGLGMLMNSFLDVGVSAAYPYYTLKKKDKEIESGFELHVMWLGFFLMINHALYALGVYGLIIFMTFTISYIISNQNFYASKLKTKEKANTAVFISSGVYFVLLALVGMSYLGGLTLSIQSINFWIQSYALVLFLYGCYRFFKYKEKDILKKYLKILKFSVNLLVSSILLFSITVSGRILVEYFFDFDKVAVYSFYYRLATIVVMIYQVVAILYFKKIYTQSPKILDKYFSIFFVFIFSLSFIFYFAAPYIVPQFSTFFKDTLVFSKELFFILSCQMVMWIATALNSNIIDREGVAKVNNYRVLVLLSIGLGVLMLCKNIMTLELLVLIIYTFFYFTVLTQYFSLYKKKIFFVKSGIYLTLMYLFSLFCLHYLI
jgi:O-antigen/teichoic acid export membrane protein